MLCHDAFQQIAVFDTVKSEAYYKGQHSIYTITARIKMANSDNLENIHKIPKHLERLLERKEEEYGSFTKTSYFFAKNY